MKKTLSLVFALCLTISSLQAQQTLVTYNSNGVTTFDTTEPPYEVLDTTNLVVSYRMLYQRRSDSDKPLDDLMLLESGRGVSKYYSYKTYQTDSLVLVTPPEQIMADLASFRGGDQCIVFQHPAKNELTHIDKIARDYVLYTEPLTEFGWELTDGEREIIGYACRRATCTFRGRNYEAWYAEEIPMSLGPWKFRGLPGLILSVKDDAGVLNLEATGIAQRAQPIKMHERNYMKANRKKYMELKHKIMTDPVGYLTANSNVQMKISGPDGSPLAPGQLLRKFNPIELE